MTGGQVKLNLNQNVEVANQSGQGGFVRLSADRALLKVVMASDDEVAAHNTRMELVEKASGGSLWNKQ